MADDALSPLPKPKYLDLIQPKPLNYQQASQFPVAESNISEHRGDKIGEIEEVNEDIELTTASTSFSSVVLGKGINQETNKKEPVVVGDVERRGGVYILGQPRTGKSTLLLNMMLQDIRHGHGLCFIDPHGDAIEEIIKHLPDDRLDDVILLDPLDEDYAVGLHLFECREPRTRTQISRTINYVLQVFGKLFTESGNLQDATMLYDTLLNTIILLVYNQSYTLAEVPLILVNRDAAAKLIPHIGVAHDDEKEWWQEYNRGNLVDKEKLSGSTRRRLRTFLTDENVRHIVGQNRSTIDFRAIMDTGKILLVKLPREFPELTKLVGSLIIGQLLTAAYSRDDTPEDDRRQFCLYCDEFQNFATPDFAQLFTQTGKYHIAPTVAHQERVGQFAEEKKILGATSAAAIKVLFQTTVKDAEEFSPEFARRPESAWEEELEKEWVEVLEGERHERIEEQITDMMDEDVKAPPPDPLDYLKHHPHGNPEIDVLIQKVLSPLFIAFAERKIQVFFPDIETEKLLLISFTTEYSNWQEAEEILNQLLIDAMAGRLDFSYPSSSPSSVFSRVVELVTLLRGYFRLQSDTHAFANTNALRICTTYFFDPHESATALSTSIKAVVSLWEKEHQYGHDEWYHGRPAGNIPSTFTAAMRQAVERRVREVVVSTRSTIQTLLTLLRKLASDPILMSTGQRRLVPRKRTQVHYITHPRQTLTHPRRTIMHPQRTFADMVNEMEHELSHLPRFTAYCKIVRAIAGQQKVVKYKLSPEAPESIEDEENAWSRKRAYILARMHDETLGYYKKREHVEQEIAARRAALKAKEPKRKGQTTADEDEE